MLQRMIAPNGVVYYQSPQLHEVGVTHAFSTRLGGVSAAPFDSLNLANPSGGAIHDDVGRVQVNYQRLLQAIGCLGRQLCRVHQVHGARAVLVSGQTDLHSQEADAVITEDPACIASIRVADCVPVLLASEDGRLVAAVHAGWRGAIAGVVPAAIAAMREAMDGRANALLAAIGPCIGPDAFEVGDEVAEVFARAFPESPPVSVGGSGKAHVDMRRAVRMQLVDAGIREDHMDGTDRCTYRDRDEFFSHRRDKGITGRMAAIITPRSQAISQ
jgi:polyphenol oxidase